MQATLHLLLLLCAAAPLAAAAQDPAPQPPAQAASRAPETREQLERRLASVSMLIESSSAARQIDASAVEAARAQRAEAREMQRRAAALFRDGRQAEAAGLLDQAAKTMFLAVRQAAPEQVANAKLKRDFDIRMESVTALLAAQKRISGEKRQGGTAVDELEARRARAVALAAAGQLEQARALLDQVYQGTRLAIETMRNGDTLVRSLSFATKEEEYRYEIDRNDTHAMLVKVLLDEKRRANPGIDGMVAKFLDQAARLRSEAEAKAGARNFEAAIALLEDATRELVRAIRGAGVYIPG